MGETVAVLVVPAEGDPGGLLAQSRPPDGGRLYDVDDQDSGYALPRPSVACSYFVAQPPVVALVVPPNGAVAHALPLWWDGALVPEGWDRFVRAACTLAGDDRPVSRFPALADVLRAASPSPGTAASLLASRVIRLARVDGRLVEVP